MPRFAHVQRTIGVNGITYRSKMEANYAAYLEFLRTHGVIRSWEYEPGEFWFTTHAPPQGKRPRWWLDPRRLKLTGVLRGRVSYKPDFRIVYPAGLRYVEVKGYMDARSKTVLARARRYFPEVIFELVDGPAMRALKRQVGGAVPGWVE